MRVPCRATDCSDPDTFDACLEQQFHLCQQLEALADSLPSKLDTRAAMMLTDQLRTVLRRCHRTEETIIFPALQMADPQTKTILERLRQEHLEDEDHASDVCDAVRAFVDDINRKKAEELGYMLRCLFVSLRRHLAFDHDYILPLYFRTRET